MLITGQCGTGKTFLLRCMLSIRTRMAEGGHSFQTGIFEPLPRICRDGRVVQRCWFYFHCRVFLLIWIKVGQGPGQSDYPRTLQDSITCMKYFARN